MKKIVYLFIVVFTLSSCANDDFIENNNEQRIEIIHEKLTYKQVTERMNNTSKIVFKESTKTAFNENYNLLVANLNKTNSTTNEGEDAYIDYYYDSVHNNETYSFITHEFSEEEYFLEKFVITIEEGEQKVAYLRYYPSNIFSLENFTGKIEIISLDRSFVGDSYFENGVRIPQQSNNYQTNSVNVDCITTISIKSTRCTNGGNHRFGEQCGRPDLINDAYLYVTNFTTCNTTVISNVVPVSSVIIEAGPKTGGGGSSNLVIQESNFLNSLPMAVNQWISLDINQHIKAIVLSYLRVKNFTANEQLKASQLLLYISNDSVLKNNSLLAELIIKQILFSNKYTVQEFENFWNNLTPQQKAVFNNYVNNNLTTGTHQMLKQSAQTFLNWAFNYLIDNPTVTVEQFENWFMVTTNGKDGDYDANYWENPNLVIQQQNLPSYDDFYNEFPLKNGGMMPSSEVYQLVGGQLYNSHLANPSGYSNACAIRVSRALNYSGVIVPNIPGQTEKGADNKNYFLSAKNLNAWMEKTFGKPTGSNRLTGAQGGINGKNFPDLLQDKQGVYIMIANYPGPNYFGATGHADIMENGTCPDDRCYFNATGGVHFINVWELN